MNTRPARPWLLGFFAGAIAACAAVALLARESPDASESPLADPSSEVEIEQASPKVPLTVHLGEDAQASGRIRTCMARTGALRAEVTLQGVVRFDETRLARVLPVVGGIVKEVPATLGAHVRAGDVLAVIESREFGEAKYSYLECQRSLELAQAERDRQSVVRDNTNAMLGLLASDPPATSIAERLNALSIGETKGIVMAAYANMVAARSSLTREQGLATKGISSQQEFEAARSACDSAEAEYRSAIERFVLTSDLALQDAQNKVSSAEAASDVAERYLHILGLDAAEIDAIRMNDRSNLSRYEVRSPLSGRVVARAATTGEKVTADREIFSVADLTSVWVVAYAAAEQRLPTELGVGTEASIVALGLPGRNFVGTLWDVGSVVDERTHTLPIRLRSANEEGLLRPGMYVRVTLTEPSTNGGDESVRLIVPDTALQTVNGRTSVFVRAGPRDYRLVAVGLGASAAGEVEIVEGLETGDEVVSEGSLLLKAELATASIEDDE